MAETFIATDGVGTNLFQPTLYFYGANLYQLVPSPPTSSPIQMWKSTDNGVSWAIVDNLLSNFASTAAVVLLGTQLYIFDTGPVFSLSGRLSYFDFTIDNFVTVSTTGSVPSPNQSFLAGPDQNHIYLVQSKSPGPTLTVGEFIFNAYTPIGTLASILGASYLNGESVIFGASGILHILYSTNPLGNFTDPSQLCYCNVQAGSLVGTTASTVVLSASAFSDGLDSVLPGFPGMFSAPVQIGSQVFVSYYDPYAQAVMLLSFNDSPTPSFSTVQIDPSFAVAIAPATGAGITMLAYLGSTLYSFYTNWSLPNISGVFTNVGDANLYYRTSKDNGATWSPRKTVLQHLDPLTGNPVPILVPEAVQFVGPPPSSIATIPLTYRTNVSSGTYKYGRFYSSLSVSRIKNYVRS